jgi:glycine/D-amino acid oxidase-like deaminating enzyme
MNPSTSGQHIAVIGAGVIGVCSALYLQRAGFRVTLIDRGGAGEGASLGNGAIIGDEAVVPVATPGLLWKVPGMLADPLGPLAIRWSYLPRLAPWLMRFAMASGARRVEEISIALAALMDGCLDAYAPLLEQADAKDMIRRTGWVSVYESEAGFRAYAPMLELQRRRGVRFDVLEAEALRQLEPALAPIFAKAVLYPDVGYTVNSHRLVQVLAAAMRANGGAVRRAEVSGFDIGPAGPRAVLTYAGPVACDAVLIAAGAWSRPLATERGYHVQFPEPGVTPRLPVYSTERAFVATPLELGLRIAGTVELGGLQAPPNWDRAEVLANHARRWFPGLRTGGKTRWLGFRPSMPDSLPVIGRSPRFSNVYLAFGHGHCGMMLGPRTGALVADLAAGRDPGIDMSPYRPDRF